MKKKIVLKRLSASDLTLFEYHYKKTPGAKQKAFNLDVEVFVNKLYPGLPERDRMDINQNRIPLDLSIFGPGKAELHNLQRKILKQQKNWRLDGELIHNPTEEKNRYDSLRKGDFAIIEFSGDSQPYAARMYLIASSLSEDMALHKDLEEQYGSAFSARKGMEAVDPDALASLITQLDLEDGHPLLDLVGTDVLEDVVQGGIEGFRQLKKRRKARGLGRDEFEKARRSAEQTGRLGEEILKSWFEAEMEQAKIPGFRWDSDDNAISPFDFSIVDNGDILRKIDAKSTTGDFRNPIHVSLAELLEMAEGGTPYDIYRLYFVMPESASMRIARDVGVFAKSVLDALTSLPSGVYVDGVSIGPDRLCFSDEIIIDFSTPAEDQMRGNLPDE